MNKLQTKRSEAERISYGYNHGQGKHPEKANK
jgi:hypothetical protein